MKMRAHGTLTKWNDDRGFGFITPAKEAPDVFVHISAFPREGGRPRLNELISFEVESGRDGKLRAVRVMRTAQRTRERPVVPRDRQRAQGRKLGGALVLLTIAVFGAYGYSRYVNRVLPRGDSLPDTATLSASSSPRYSCDGRTMCSQMTSCAEATYFLRNCPNTTMDGDRDGVPCESQWCQ